VHRKHHRFSDQKKDPHSPKNISFVKIHTRSMEESVELAYATDILRSKFYIWCHINHWLICGSIMAILLIIDPRAVLYIWLVPNFIQWYLGGLVNYMNHTKFGYRNYNTDDISNNNPLTGYFMMGEGWHNNHHAEPGNPRFGHKWYEFDIGWWFIKLIKTNR
jgi:stearoyl-CoA desaturase (delta-9 desaturase)